jgi:hypothetical protein
MSLDPRAEELISGYPDQLEDSQLAELRSLAEQDLLVAAMMDSIHEAEALLRSGAETVEMSEQGLALLQDVVAETLSGDGDSDQTVEDLMAPISGGSATSAVDLSTVPDGAERAVLDVVEEGLSSEDEQVVSLAERRRVRSGPPMWQAFAALLVLGIGYSLWGGGTTGPTAPTPGVNPANLGGRDLQVRGGDTADLPLAAAALLPQRSELVVMSSGDVAPPDGDPRLRTGTVRPTNQPIQFEAVLKEARSLALVEAEAGGNTWVLYPPRGSDWDVEAGANILHPVGAPSPEFLPKSAGLVSYILVGGAADARFEIAEDGQIESLGRFLSEHKAEVIDRLEISWVAPK